MLKDVGIKESTKERGSDDKQTEEKIRVRDKTVRQKLERDNAKLRDISENE